jgi:hypothetical protein
MQTVNILKSVIGPVKLYIESFTYPRDFPDDRFAVKVLGSHFGALKAIAL